MPAIHIFETLAEAVSSYSYESIQRFYSIDNIAQMMLPLIPNEDFPTCRQYTDDASSNIHFGWRTDLEANRH